MKLVEVRKVEGVKALVNTGAVAAVMWDDMGPVWHPNGAPAYSREGVMLQGSFRVLFLGGANEFFLDNPLELGDTREKRLREGGAL